MNELDTRIYELLERPMRVEELRRLAPEAGKQALKDSLVRLSESGKILKNKKNKFAHAEHFGCLAGVFLATERGFAFVAPDDKTDEGDIFIPPHAQGGAWQGDRVLVRVKEGRGRAGRDGRRKREGEVIRLLERSRQEIVGAVCKAGKSTYLAPASRKYPDHIILPKAHLNGAKEGDRVAVRMMFYGDKRLPPQAAVTTVFGLDGTMEASIEGILHENGIYEPFPEETLRQAGAIADKVDPFEAARRLDLRDKLIFTIDGDDAKDFDDAVSLERLENGRLLLGVHIADVSHYVTPASPLDDEAYRRGTSVYYPGRVVPMLPLALSNGICSLNPEVDRFTFSALIELDAEGRCHGARFVKAVIRSKARMTYGNVNKILAGDSALCEKYAFLADTVREMNQLAQTLNRRRMERGALELDIAEAEIVVDERGQPVDVAYRQRGESERLIEEFMLLANESAAEYMDKHDNPAVYRIHENPDPEKLRVFAQFARPFGYRIDPSRPENTKQLQRVLDGAKGDPRQRILPTLLLRSLARARYSDECIGHYGLKAKYYLHFTSPIRRYPDLAAHRMLYKAITGQQFTRADQVFCEEAAVQSTAREFAADTAERDIDKLFLAAYMEQYIGQEFDAEVSGVQPFGVFVALENSVEGLIRVESLPGYFEYDEQKMALFQRGGGARYTIGASVRVRLTAASKTTGQIDFVLADAPAASCPKGE